LLVTKSPAFYLAQIFEAFQQRPPLGQNLGPKSTTSHPMLKISFNIILESKSKSQRVKAPFPIFQLLLSIKKPQICYYSLSPSSLKEVQNMRNGTLHVTWTLGPGRVVRCGRRMLKI